MGEIFKFRRRIEETDPVSFAPSKRPDAGEGYVDIQPRSAITARLVLNGLDKTIRSLPGTPRLTDPLETHAEQIRLELPAIEATEQVRDETRPYVQVDTAVKRLEEENAHYGEHRALPDLETQDRVDARLAATDDIPQ